MIEGRTRDSAICLLPSIFYLYLALHLIECSNEPRKILRIEHDSRLLSSAGLLGDLEEFTVAALLEIDVERALATVDGHRVYLVCEASTGTGGTGRTRSSSRGWIIVTESTAGSCEF